MRLDRLEDSIETDPQKIDDCKFRDVITMKSSSIHRTIEIDNHFYPFFLYKSCQMTKSKRQFDKIA